VVDQLDSGDGVTANLDSVGRLIRSAARGRALDSALRKQASGVPTYTIPEAAALLSVSQEHLYRLVRADAFASVRMRRGDEQGKYVIPARAVHDLLSAALNAGGCLDVAEWAETWRAEREQMQGGAA
jgi:excisionase family DNA binding protein